jgi:hypothetical protein
LNADQRRQFFVQHLRRRVADDQVEGVVDMRLAFGAVVIVGHRGAQRLALDLRRERNHRGGAAASGGARAAVEVVGHSRGRRHRLVEVAVRIDTARRHDPAGGVDLALAGRQSLAELHDASADDADVGIEGIARGGHAGVAHHQVEIAHCQAPRADWRENDVEYTVDNDFKHMTILCWVHRPSVPLASILRATVPDMRE